MCLRVVGRRERKRNKKQGRRILAEKNAKKAEENTWIGWVVAAESIRELNGLIRSRAA